MIPFRNNNGGTSRRGRWIPDLPHQSSTHGNTPSVQRAVNNNNTLADSTTIQPNDIVVGSPTQNNAIATIPNSTIVASSPTLNNASSVINEIVDGSPTQNNAPILQVLQPNNDIVDGNPTLKNANATTQ